MRFWEALKNYEEGRCIRCSSWPKDKYISLKKYDGVSFLDYYDWRYCNGQDWELYEEPVQLLSWLEVVKGLKEGRSYRRQGWDKKRFANGDDEILMHGTEILGITELFLEDFEANNWIEVKDVQH